MVARGCVWIVVVDQAVETHPSNWGGGAVALALGRRADVVTFTAYPETIEDLIADAIRAAGLRPTRRRANVCCENCSS